MVLSSLQVLNAKPSDGGTFTSINVPKHITNNNATSTTVVEQKVDGTGTADIAMLEYLKK